MMWSNLDKPSVHSFGSGSVSETSADEDRNHRLSFNDWWEHEDHLSQTPNHSYTRQHILL